MTPEFNLIAKYFTRPTQRATLGIGDDCALIVPTPDCELAISTDTLASGIHFFADADPCKLGHKALAVNLSDLAAMGAQPRFVTLALTLPSIDPAWLAEFSRGFFALADASGIELIGGDTTRGPLSITLTVFGEIAAGKALRRSCALAGDEVWVSGTLGGAAIALKHLQGNTVLSPAHIEAALAGLHTPIPRNALGCALVGVAHAAIDISDGLVADLAHICERSNHAASVDYASIPLSPALRNVSPELARTCALAGGDDYELCFTAPAAQRDHINAISASLGIALTRIGEMRAGNTHVTVLDADGEPMTISNAGFDHFTP